MTVTERAESLIWAQVKLEVGYGKERRTLLGDVRGWHLDGSGDVRLAVHHFNGEPWPFSPGVAAVEVLERSGNSPDPAGK